MSRGVEILVLSVGGALGVNARYWQGLVMARWVGPRFPWSTLAINVTGSFAMGFLTVVLASRWPQPLFRLFVLTGFLGGYTTFSAFAFDSIRLWEEGERRLSSANMVVSVAASIAAVALGLAMARSLVGPPKDGPRPLAVGPETPGDV